MISRIHVSAVKFSSAMAMRYGILLLLLVGSYKSTYSQKNVELWTLFKEVKWEYKYSRAHGAAIAFPSFSEKVHHLNGKQITVKGYVMPVKFSENKLLISAKPNQHCLHCHGGISSIIAISSPIKQALKPNQLVEVVGKLFLNDKNDGLIYYLKNATVIGETNSIFKPVAND